MKKIAIVVLNFNGGEQILQCLKSVQSIKLPVDRQIELIVVDNRSNDDSVQLIKAQFPRIDLLKNKKNLGFAAGSNIGIKHALKHNADTVLLLNQDTLVKRNFLLPLLDNDADVVAPLIKFKRKGKWFYDFGGKINWWIGKTIHDERAKAKNEKVIKIDYVSGCCMLISKNVFEKIGLLDEKFFLYFEDVDFCLRAKKSGFKIAVEPKSIVLHKLVETGKKPFRQNLHLLRSYLLFVNRYIPFWRRFLVYFFWILMGFKILFL